MKKLVKKILVLGFAVTGMFLSSNKCFAERYDVSIILLGNAGVGKTNIARRLCGEEFNDEHDPTGWADGGVGGYCHEYIIGNDTFNCYFFDAPGFLKEKNPDITKQIEEAPISDMSLAFVVVDPADNNHGGQYSNSVQEAFARHTVSLRERNSNCGIVIVTNKSDLLSDDELKKVKKMVEATKIVYEGVSVNSVIVSAKNKSAFESLEKIIKDFLVSHKNVFAHAHKENCFKYCANCKKKFFPSENCRGKYCGESCLRNAEGFLCFYSGCSGRMRNYKYLKNDPGVEEYRGHYYCSARCIRDAEGFLCSYSKCSSRMRNEKFLKNDPGVEKYNGNYYCSSRCLHDDKGTACGNDKNCPNMRPKLLPYEGVESCYPRSAVRYCDTYCRKEKEYRQCPKCSEFFPPNDSDAVEGKKSSKLYCSEKCRRKSEDCCIM